MFLVVYDVYARPVHRDNDVVLWQARPGELVRLVEARVQQWPLVLGVVYDVFFDVERRDAVAHEVTLPEAVADALDPVVEGLCAVEGAVGDVAGEQRLHAVEHHVGTVVYVVLLGGDHSQVIVLST